MNEVMGLVVKEVETKVEESLGAEDALNQMKNMPESEESLRMVQQAVRGGKRAEPSVCRDTKSKYKYYNWMMFFFTRFFLTTCLASPRLLLLLLLPKKK